jgi:hypothetical protein
MRPWGKVTSLASGIRLYRLTSIAAMLICFAVVLNIGPFAKPPERVGLPGIGAQSAAPTSLTGAQTGAGVAPDRSQSSAAALNRSEPTGSLLELPVRETAVVRTAYEPVGSSIVTTATADPGIADLAAEHASIVGVWAPDASACSVRDFRDGLLPTLINTEGAWAGDTVCIFNNQKQTATGWRVAATCSNPREHWTADVRLTVKDDRLTWTSKRGRQVYTRCAPKFLTAAAR